MAYKITRHLWQLYDDDGRRLGAVLRVNGDTETHYVSQPEGAPQEAWRSWPTFKEATEALQPEVAPPTGTVPALRVVQ